MSNGQPTEAISDPLKKAFDFISESTKQMIALATGLVTVSIAFLKDVNPSANHGFFIASWVLLYASIFSGIVIFLFLAGSLAAVNGSGLAAVDRIWVRLSAGVQLVTFAIGLFLTVFIGIDGELKSVTAKPISEVNVINVPEIASAVGAQLVPAKQLTGQCSELDATAMPRFSVQEALATFHKVHPKLTLEAVMIGVPGQSIDCEMPPGNPVWIVLGSPAVTNLDAGGVVTVSEIEMDTGGKVIEGRTIEVPRTHGVRSKWAICPLWPVCS